MAKAYASTVINCSPDALWARIRDFNDMPSWNPAIVRSEIENHQSPDAVGCIRNFWLTDGNNIRERLLALSDSERFMVYNFEKTHFPVRNYHATLRVTPVTDGNRSFIEWWTTFDCAEADEARMIDTFANDVFQFAFDALKRHFEPEQGKSSARA